MTFSDTLTLLLLSSHPLCVDLPSPSQLTASIGYFSIPVIKHHDQDNLWKEGYIDFTIPEE